MANRKETPDVLGEILAGAAGPIPAMPAPSPAKPKPRRKPAQAKAPQPAEVLPVQPPLPQGWDYLVVSLQDYRGWRPRYIDGQEIADWTAAPLIHDYLAQLGGDGWELTAASAGKRLYGSSDEYQLYFKRAKPAQPK